VPPNEDQTLPPDELESLLDAAKDKASQSAASQSAEGEPSPSASADSANEAQPSKGAGNTADDATAEELLEQAEANLAAAVDPNLDSGASAETTASAGQPASPSNAEASFSNADSTANTSSKPDAAANLDEAQRLKLEDFENAGTEGDAAVPFDSLQDLELDVRIELGRTELLIEDVLKLKEGSVVSLDKLAGDPVDILVNGRLVARGEVLVLNDNFCVRVAEILAPDA